MTEGSSYRRRSFLKTLASVVVAGGVAGCPDAQQHDTTTTRTGERRSSVTETQTPANGLEAQFDTVVDAVADVGCDPTGTEPCNEVLRDAVTSDVLVRFPDGRFLFERSDRPIEADHVGFVGETETTFVPRQGINGHILGFDAGTVRFSGIDIDQRAPSTTTGLNVITDDGFHVADVTVYGRGLHKSFTSWQDTDDRITHYFGLAVRNPDAEGVLRNATIRKGDAWAHYRGATGVWIGRRHEGTIKIVDCQIEECGGNGVYASANTGQVQVEGGLFRNNNVASIRISGEGSYVDGARVEVDPAVYSGPRTREDDQFQLRGIVVEQKLGIDLEQPAGAVVKNCSLDVRRNPTAGSAIDLWSNGKTVTVRDTRIRMGNDAPAIDRAGRSDQGRHPPAAGPRWVRCENVLVTDRGEGSETIRLRAAPESRFSETVVRGRGSDRTGIRLVESPRCVLDNVAIQTTNVPVAIVAESTGEAQSCLLSIRGSTTLRGFDEAFPVGVQGTVVATVELADDGCLDTSQFESVDSKDSAGVGVLYAGDSQLSLTRL